VGRWPKGSDYQLAKARNASVRTTQYHLVNEGPAAAKAKAKKAANTPGGWQLFDVKADPAESKNIAAENPEIVKRMLASYDAFWDSLAGQIDLNEKAVGPKLNPFAEEYWAQFGGGPSEQDLKRMDPEAAFTFESKRAAKK
jgi:arylsulfatase